jgi:hypothetical protein
MATVHGKLVQEAWKSEREWGWVQKVRGVREGGELGRKSFDFAECVVVREIGADNG